jgi:hypothetical protein
MGWSRIGDEFPADRRWDGVPYEARWHYLALMAACSKSQRFDCRMPLMLAHRASDVPDPEAATEALLDAGLVVIDGSHVTIVDGEAQHMLPPSKRDHTRKENQRRWTQKHRQIKCETGEHDANCPATCPRRSEEDSRKPLHDNQQEPPQPSPIGLDRPDAVRESPLYRRGEDSRKALLQDRTGQDRTAPGRVLITTTEALSDFLPPKARSHGE